jgi:hypothetical protein
MNRLVHWELPAPSDHGLLFFRKQPRRQPSKQVIGFQALASPQCAFPHCQDTPARFLEPILCNGITFPVAADLIDPKLSPSGRNANQGAVVPVPKTPVDKNGRTI